MPFLLLGVLICMVVLQAARFEGIAGAGPGGPAAPDFSISVSPGVNQVYPGWADTWQVTVKPLNGFTGTVSLSTSGLPAAATAVFSNPVTITSSASVTTSLIINTTAAAAIANTNFDIVGTSGLLSHNADPRPKLEVRAFPDKYYTLTLTPRSGATSVPAGGTLLFDVAVNRFGLNGKVKFALPTNLPAGVTASFSPVETSGNTSVLTFTNSAASPVALYPFTVSGASGKYNIDVFKKTFTAPDASKSTLTPTSASISVGGASQVLTVQAKDASGNNVTTGGAAVAITRLSGTGTIGSVTDNGNGTYTATVTAPTATGSGGFVATLGGQPVKSGGASQTHATVTYVAGAAAELTFSLQPFSGQIIAAKGTGSFAVDVSVVDGFGNVVTTDGRQVTLFIQFNPGFPSGVLSCTNLGGLMVSAVSGVAHFTGCAITKAGAGYGLSASSAPGLAAPTNATLFNIVAGVADATQSTLAPTSSSITVGGATQTLTVQAVDENGNTVTSGGATVTITRQSSTMGSLSAVTDNVNGTYTATVTSPNSVGSGVFVATLGGQPVKSGGASQTLATVNYLAGNAAKLTFSAQPLAGQQIAATGTGSFPVDVTITDAYGNAITGDGSTSLTLAIATNPGGGALTCSNAGGLTVTAASGVAHFTGCAITKSGHNYTLTASSSPSYAAPTNANQFDIVAGTATQIFLDGSTTDLNVGSTRTLTAYIQDVNGNTVDYLPNATVSVTFTQNGGGTVSGIGAIAAVAGVATKAVTGATAGDVQIIALAKLNGSLSNTASNELDFTVVGGAVPYVISGDFNNQLFPAGTAQPIDLSFSNPNVGSGGSGGSGVIVNSLTVTIQSVTGPNITIVRPCAALDFAVTQFSGALPFYIPQGASSLSSLGFASGAWPTLRLINRPVNQDGCKGATVHLAYTGAP